MGRLSGPSFFSNVGRTAKQQANRRCMLLMTSGPAGSGAVSTRWQAGPAHKVGQQRGHAAAAHRAGAANGKRGDAEGVAGAAADLPLLCAALQNLINALGSKGAALQGPAAAAAGMAQVTNAHG